MPQRFERQFYLYSGERAAKMARDRFLYKHNAFNEFINKHAESPPISRAEELADEFGMMWYNSKDVIVVGPVEIYTVYNEFGDKTNLDICGFTVEYAA